MYPESEKKGDSCHIEEKNSLFLENKLKFIEQSFPNIVKELIKSAAFKLCLEYHHFYQFSFSDPS